MQEAGRYGAYPLPVIVGLAVLTVVVLAASGAAVAWFWRERTRVRELLAAEAGQPTEVVLKRMLRQRVHRDELAAVLFSREAVLEAAPLPVLILDREGRVVRVNAAARVAFGGVDIGGFAAELAPELGHAVSGVLSGPPVDQVEMVAGAERRVWLAHLRSHPDADGRAAVAVLVDVTEDVDFREARRLFSAAVSHELRTPLQRIVGLVDTLALPLSDGERAELVQAAEHEVQRMRELVDEMLLLAALDRGQAALSEGDCDVSAVAQRVVASRVQRARQSGMTLRVDAAGGLRVPIGEQLLEVVIGNVVDNALKYAGDGAEVEVGVRGRAGEVEIAVSDTGVGIAPEHLPHVFERFFRGEQSRSSPGSGLGLAVVKHIVEAHGGRARAESRAGEGAVVRLVLPEASVVSGS
jgi:two-component system, OmpR family, phosphate regulon sensor histidine kinase PhoR